MKLHYFFIAFILFIILESVVFTKDQKMVRPYEDEDGISYEDVYLGSEIYMPDQYYPGPQSLRKMSHFH